MIKTANATWTGGFKDGRGQVSTESGALKEVDFNAAKRFEGQKGSNPEELLGAAHAACYSMALSLFAANAGLSLEKVDTTAAVTLAPQGGGFAITKVHLTVRAKIPNATPEQFAKLAEETKANCPVSQVLRADISLDASLA